MSVAAAIHRSGSLITTCSAAGYSKVSQIVCEKKKEKSSRKINRFPLCGWAVSLACQWSCYCRGTRATRASLRRCWHEENMLTGCRNTLEHTFALQAAVRGAILQGHRVLLWWGVWDVEGGVAASQPAIQPCSTVWLSSSRAQMLLSSHKLFTSGYTKENSCTDCGWRVSHKPAPPPLCRGPRLPTQSPSLQQPYSQQKKLPLRLKYFQEFIIFIVIIDFLTPSKKAAPLRPSVRPDGRSEIKEDINGVLKEGESIYFDKDQMCLRWTFWPFQKQPLSLSKRFCSCLLTCNAQKWSFWLSPPI